MLHSLKRMASEVLTSHVKRAMWSLTPTDADRQLTSQIVTQFLCPITGELMVDPVQAPDGHTYDRTAIVKWCTMKGTSPMIPNVTVRVDQLIPNRTVKDAIRELISSGTVDETTRRSWQINQLNVPTAEMCFAQGRIQEAANLGHAAAQGIMASRYFEGDGVAQDMVQCVEWARRGAALNEKNCQFRLGYAYHMGEGVTKNYDTALHYYTQAFDNDVNESASNIAMMYQEGGPDLEKNMEKMVQWGKESNGNAIVAYYMAKAYYEGTGVVKNDVEARKYVQLAESSDAKFMYGKMLIRGEGGSTEFIKGIGLVFEAAKEGHPTAKEFCRDVKKL